MYQSITLIGNLGRDPDMRYTPSGLAVCNFSMATSEKWTGQDGHLQERTLWWRVSVFGKMGEASNTYLKKGSKVFVMGRMIGDKETGNPRIYTRRDETIGTSFEVTAAVVKFLTPKSTGSAEPEQVADVMGEDMPPL